MKKKNKIKRQDSKISRRSSVSKLNKGLKRITNVIRGMTLQNEEQTIQGTETD